MQIKSIRAKLLVIAAAMLAAVSQPLHARQADPARTDSVRLRIIRVTPVIATASRIPLSLARLGIAATLLSAADLAARRPPTAADALRDVTGLFMDESAGAGGPTIVRIRGGEEVFTQILMDGVQLNQNGGYFDFQGVTLSNIDRVEVVRGPQSALFGSSAMSGAIQFMTRAGAAGPARFEIDGEGGGATDHGANYRAQASVTGGSPQLRYSAAAGTAFDRGFYALAHDTKTMNASVRLDGAAGDRVTFTGVGRFIGMESMLPVRDAGSTRAPLDPNAMNQRERMIGSMRARINGTGALTNEIAVTGYREFFVYDDKFDNVAAAGSRPFFIFDANFVLRSTLQRGGGEYTGRWSASAGASPVALAWGASLQRETLTDRSVYEGNRNVVNFERGAGALFAEASMLAAARLNILAGARIERFGAVTSDLTPRLSVNFAALPGRLSIRAAAGTAYKAPNLQEQYADNPFIAGNPDLKPETSKSIEAGFDLRAMQDRAAFAATVFRQDYEDLIRAVALEGTDRQINRNLGSSRASGVEWELRVIARPDMTIGTDGTALKTEVLDNAGVSNDAYPVGEELPFRPDITASAFVEHGGPRIKGMLRLRYIGEQTVLTERFSGARVALDPYFVAGANVTYAVSSSLDLHVRADNLFDKRYETAFDRTGAPGRMTLGLTWRSR